MYYIYTYKAVWESHHHTLQIKKSIATVGHFHYCVYNIQKANLVVLHHSILPIQLLFEHGPV